MVDFPTIRNPSFDGLEEQDDFDQISNETESGYTIRRNRSLKARNVWRLVWNDLPELDFQTLKTFFRANRSSAFNWTHPATGAVYEVAFTQEKLTSRVVYHEHRYCECEIREV